MSYNPCHVNQPQLGQRQVLGPEGVLLRPQEEGSWGRDLARTPGVASSSF